MGKIYFKQLHKLKFSYLFNVLIRKVLKNWLAIPDNYPLLGRHKVNYQGYVINASSHFWQGGDEDNGLSLTNGLRIKHYLSSLLGVFKANIGFREAVTMASSLHCVTVKNTWSSELNKHVSSYECDCEGFMQSTECAHCLSCMSIDGNYNLKQAAAEIISGKQRGRPLKYIPTGFAAHKPLEPQSQEVIEARDANNLIGVQVAKSFDGKMYTGTVTRKRKVLENTYMFTVNYPHQYVEDDEESEEEDYSLDSLKIGRQMWSKYQKKVNEKSKLFCLTCLNNGHLSHDCTL